jgi:hypothetical protein
MADRIKVLFLMGHFLFILLESELRNIFYPFKHSFAISQ